MVSSWMRFLFRNAKTAGPLANGCVLHISQLFLMKVCVRVCICSWYIVSTCLMEQKHFKETRI